MRISRASSGISVLLLASALAAAGCGSSSAPGSSGGADNPGGKPTANIPAAGGGSCSVNVTGDVTASWTAKQDMSSVLVTYWLSESERSMLSMAEGEENFLINCKGSAGSLSMYSTTDTMAAQFPKGPGTYAIAAGGLFGSGDPGQVSLLITIGEDALWKVPEPGTFTVTTLDGHKFAGTFQATIVKLGDDLETVVATSNLSGSFDFDCVSGGCG